MDPNTVRDFFTKNPFNLIKKTAIVLTVLFVLIAGFKWYGYSNDDEYLSRLKNCEEKSGSHSEYKDCIVFPIKDHLAKKASATLYTWITVLIPVFLFGSYYTYAFFFIKKRSDI